MTHHAPPAAYPATTHVDPARADVTRTPPAYGVPQTVPSPARPPARLPDPATQLVPTRPRAPIAEVAAPAGRSRLHPRHYRLAVSFALMVLLPVVVSAWYLWAHAANQYASVAGFSVHREDGNPAAGLLGGLAGLSGSGSSDTDILYQYINSQQLVAEVDRRLGLRAMWSSPAGDPIFAYPAPGSIESLVDYWRKMVSVRYDSGARLIEVQVLAFAPQDAQAIATAILASSTEMINRLNDVAAVDGQRFAQAELARTKDRLIAARAEVTRFRNLNQMVDPGAELAVQSGIIATLQQELTGAQVHLDLLQSTTIATDLRLPPAERRVAVISAQIAAERAKLGQGDVRATNGSYADLVAEFERLGLERQFAEEAYLAARAANEVTLADVGRQGRYLAAHILPTLPEAARYPARMTRLLVIATFALALWAVGALIYYALRDRR